MQHSTSLDRADTQISFPLLDAGPKAAFVAAAVGSIVDRRYRLVRAIAAGGGGAVFEAEHLHTGARVALKALHPAGAARGARARILREALVLGMVRHPNVVSVIDAGECQNHGSYVVIDLVDGRTLESFVTGRARLGVWAVVALVAQLADALSALAARRIVHRDIKPANVLVVPGTYGKPDTAVLIDFGISRLQDEGAPAGARLTLDGDLVGTPEYMAPEQVERACRVDHRADVYALGVLAYECLTGTTPFSGEPMSVLSALLTGAKPAPMSRYRPDVPPALEAAVLRAMSRDPAQRWPDAASFARACTAATGGVLAPLYLYASAAASADAAASPANEATRRKAERVPYRAPARLLWSEGTACDAKIEDISSGGLLVASYALLAPESSLSVRLALPLSGRIVVVPCAVRWVRVRGSLRLAGLEFLQLPPEAAREIDLFVQPLD